MKLTNYLFSFLIGYTLLSCYVVQATTLIKGNGTSPLSFNQTITTQVFDRSTGTFFVGLTGGGGTSALSSFARTQPTNVPAFTPIGTSNTLNSMNIELLALATTQGNFIPNLALTTFNNAPLSQTSIILSNNTGKTVTQSAALNDASGSATTGGIVALAGNSSFIFAAVRPNGGNFGDAGSTIASGIALLSYNPTTLVTQTTNAITGLVGNQAFQLNDSSNVLKGGSPDAVVFQNTNTVNLIWDYHLQSIFIGVSITSGTGAGDFAKGVVVGYNDETNNDALNLIPICPDGAIDNAQNELIVAAGTSKSVTIKKIGIMHCSSGPSYLIVNGGGDVIANVGNQVWALPLVDNPTNLSTNGTLAKYNAPLINNVFVTPATASGDLVNDTIAAAKVGASILPLPANGTISNMVVVGDTVYVSIATPQSSINDAGIFYSQAIFDQTGKINNWTPWTKRGFPWDGFTSAPVPGSVSFFDVDAVTGKLVAINGGSNQQAMVSTWDKRTIGTSLSAVLNSTLIHGCTALLDLDQSTRGFLNNTIYRYALFGGQGIVAFALTSTAYVNNSVSSSQLVTTDFTQPANYLITNLPQGSDYVLALEYTRKPGGTANNYFLAGTNQGLYVFAQADGSGFDSATLATLNQVPFFSGSWQKINTITGSITAIKTVGNSIYILAQQMAEQGLSYTVYAVQATTNISTMFAPAAIFTLATTTTGVFNSIVTFFDLNLIATANNTTEQIILGTNQGLYRTSTPGGANNATNQTNAAWVSINTSDTNQYYTIADIDNASIAFTQPSMVWPLSIQDQSKLLTFERNSISQLAGTADAGPFNYVPSFFNSVVGSHSAFATLDRSVYFWSDGTRRFFIAANPNNAPLVRQLLCLPYNTPEWNIVDPDTQIIYDSVLSSIPNFYWIKQIGATGILMAGTPNGVVALE